MATQQLTLQDRFSPDSACATWDEKERASSDRMEAEYNMRQSSIMALADEKRGHTVRGFSDSMMVSLATRYRRQIEDIADGSLTGGKRRQRVVEAKLRDIEREQEYRAAMAESWLASEDGTHCYSSFQARGGLAAVLRHAATPPTYQLASLLDWEHWKLGLPHVLDWEADSAAA